jgi:hypothetical protein
MKNLITQEEIEVIDQLCSYHSIEHYTINNDGTVDVDGDVHFYMGEVFSMIPIKFNQVSGSFRCNHGGLTTLKNAPSEVGGDFSCVVNYLTSFEYCPSKVGGDFNCEYNEITSLKHCPTDVGGTFNCCNNSLTSLEYAPKRIGGNFFCTDNKFDVVFFKAFIELYTDAYLDFDADEHVDFADDCSGDIRTFLKYHSYYDVWTPAFNKENMKGLIDDIKDGLL